MRDSFLHNYHTHTWRCHHADGEDRAYVESAIRCGLKTLGFSDHTPYPFSNGYESHIRMRLDQMEDYVSSVLSLKKEYERDITIRLGVEAEYYPRDFERLLRFMDDFPLDYMILGQHFLTDEKDDFYSGSMTKDPLLLGIYVDRTIQGMETGRFLYLAHPDLIHFTGRSSVYRKEMQRLCRAAKRLDIPLEINLQGIWLNRHYPTMEFWRVAGEEGNKVVIGSDAHSPDKVVPEEALHKAFAMAEEYDLKLVDDVYEEGRQRNRNA
ncbi:MAG: histidinol-phosphatase [Blautia sp.]|nr:histidinol-phosphatase [Blautia sp.]